MNSQLISAEPGPLVEHQPLANDPLALVSKALDQGVDPEKLGKLIDLAEKMQAIQAKQAYAVAIAGFQADCPRVLKSRPVNKKDGGLMYNFAAYEDVKRVTQPLEAKHHITTSFDFKLTESGHLNGTLYITVGSHTEQRSFLVPIAKGMNTNATQDFGGAVTYLKRYLYCAAFDIVITGEDNDARFSAETINEAEQTEIELLMREKDAQPDRFFNWISEQAKETISRVNEIPKRLYGRVVSTLKAKKINGGGQ